MFNLFKTKKKEVQLLSPIDGNVVNLSEVPDPVFSSGMMGQGFGVEPTGNKIISPINGEVTMIADTKHGIGIKTNDGLEVLIHMGIDTVELKGEPFNIDIKVGDHVDEGQQLGTVSIKSITEAGKNPMFITVITNSTDTVKEFNVQTGEIKDNKAAQLTLV